MGFHIKCSTKNCTGRIDLLLWDKQHRVDKKEKPLCVKCEPKAKEVFKKWGYHTRTNSL